MELILINESKLKVMLTPSDMESYSITCDTIDYENTETRRAFWNILDEAKHKTGFDAARDRIFIQVYPSKNGGCELYVTKLIHNDCPYNETPKEDNITCRINIKRPVVPEIYSFDNIDYLITACNQLARNGYIEESSVFADKDGKKYYLVLSGAVKNMRFNRYSFITEYGDRRNGNFFELYLSEYCTCICEDNAVGILSKL